MQQGTLFDIKRFAIHDGPGIRTTVFLKGCPLDCWWCHNPEGRRRDPEFMAAGPGDHGPVSVGRVVTADEVMVQIEKDVLYYDESDGGVTFSGGEPLFQPLFLAELLSRCRDKGLHTALDTTGFAPTDIMARVSPLVDLFLFDLKIIEDGRHRAYTGVSNRGILKNLGFLAGSGCKVTIRFPLIPQVNDTPEDLEQMRATITGLGLRNIDILPYHGIHRQKYHRLGYPDRLGHLTPPTDDAIARVKAYFETGGLSVRVGG